MYLFKIKSVHTKYILQLLFFFYSGGIKFADLSPDEGKNYEVLLLYNKLSTYTLDNNMYSYDSRDLIYLYFI